MVTRMQLAVILLLLFTAGHLKSLGATDWLLDAWRVEEGLPDNVVDAITQTPDGYLWVGTQGGLVRFDGVRFSTIDDPAFKIERVRQLYVDRSGRLWVLGENGDVASIHEGQVKSFTSPMVFLGMASKRPPKTRRGKSGLARAPMKGAFVLMAFGLLT